MTSQEHTCRLLGTQDRQNFVKKYNDTSKVLANPLESFRLPHSACILHRHHLAGDLKIWSEGRTYRTEPHNAFEMCGR